MSEYPVKNCDYCDHVGKAFTFANGETTCKTCLSDLGGDTRSLKLLVKRLQAENAKLQQANDEAQSLIGLLEAEVGKLKRERDNYAEISIAKWCAKNYANKLNK